MPEPLLKQGAPPFWFEAFYEEGRYRVVVTHESDPAKIATGFVDPLHEPLFGVDVEDADAIRAMAEQLARKLEAPDAV